MSKFELIMVTLGRKPQPQGSKPEQLAAALLAAPPDKLAALARKLRDLDFLDEFHKLTAEIMRQRLAAAEFDELELLSEVAKEFGVWKDVVRTVADRNKEVYALIEGAETVESLHEVFKRVAGETDFMFQRYRNCGMRKLETMIMDAGFTLLNELGDLATRWRMKHSLMDRFKERDEKLAALQAAYVEENRPHMQLGNITALATDVREYRRLLRQGYVEVPRDE